MNKIKIRKTGIALLMLMLMAGNLTIGGWAKTLHAAKVVPVPADWLTVEKEEVMDALWGSFSMLAADPHISDLTLGHDKKMSEPTDEFGSNDTIFAEVEIADHQQTLKVKGRLHVVEIPGQKAGPIAALDVIVTVTTREDTANFQLSKPTNGWPKGKYMFEALLMDASGKTIDTESHEFTVH